MKKYDNVPLKSQLVQYEEWAKALKPGMMGNLYFLPWVGMAYRVAQFENYLGKDVSVIDLQSSDGEDLERIGKLPSKGKHILLLKDVLLKPDGEKIALALEKWLVEYAGGALFVHELPPISYNNKTLPSWVRANILYYRIPDTTIVKAYINNVSREINLKLSLDDTKLIADACGGWLWLVKDILRTKAIGTRSIEDCLKSDTFCQKMGLIWDSWPVSYHGAICGINNDDVLNELVTFGVVDADGHVNGTSLSNFIKNKSVSDVEIIPEVIRYRDRDLSDRFTKGERKVLETLWQYKQIGKRVPREDLPILFGDETGEMSDWTIDQKMRRLRQKLVKLQIPIVIETKKGEGYGIR